MMNTLVKPSVYEDVSAKLTDRTAVVGVIGLGYVGLPLADAVARAGFSTIGFDIDIGKIDRLNSGHSYIDAVSDEALGDHIARGLFRASAAFSELADCDVVIICVPTPLSRHRDPDLRYVEATAATIAAHLTPATLVILESTTYPGTTEEVLIPLLERSGLRSGRDFFVAFSPEREDPGNKAFETSTIPKVVAGDGEEASHLVRDFFSHVIERVVVVSTPSVAEAVKITENVFRSVNIALVNELKVIYQAMGIDIWEVIDAAATKPFGFMPFYPGPGLGGHCIPIDPFYLSWKSKEFGLSTRFIELAGEINLSMPAYVISTLEQGLDQTFRLSLGASRILLLGLAYKKNVSDIRESPALELMALLQKRGVAVDFHDPFVPLVPDTREHPDIKGAVSVTLTADSLSSYDAVVIATDHDAIDYPLVAEHARMVVDTRNAFSRRNLSPRVLFKA